MPEFWNFIMSQIQGNEFFQGGFVLAFFGSLAVWGRQLPSKAWSLTKRLLIVECDIQQRDEAFQALTHWLAEHPYGKRVKRFTASTRDSRAPKPASARGGQVVPEVMLSPAPGNHWIWFQGRLIRFLRSREKSKVDQVLMDFYESYTLQTWGRKRDILESLVKEAVAAFARQAEGCTRVWIMARYDGWREVSRLPHRSLDSVVLPEGAREFLSQDLEQFANARERYAHLGVPYRRGYLFYGPPGTGKTSLGMALASHLNLDIAVVSLGDAGLDDNKLVNFLLEAPQGAVLLLEDLDCLYQEDRTKKQTGVTLSGLLNILDGVAAQESRVVIMTTNHPEKLDEALIRPGRADVHMLLENATLFQSRCLFQRFFPKASPAQAEEFAQRMGDRKQSPANIQRHLMAYQGSAEAALENAQDIGLGRFRK